ncbi:MAG: peptidylprolyl isomerase [Candidatus Terrybacteria bacterium]|nr:peptidylprolyl isomerase [Candidatus Terrybacteria bacterium]
MRKLLIGAGFVLAVIIILLVAIPPPTPPSQNDEPEQAEAPDSSEKTPRYENFVKARIVTAAGDIVLALYPDVAPKTVENFIQLTQEGFYDGVTFHRVVPGFVIQAGDPLSKDDDPSNDGSGGPGYTFEDEINPQALGLTDEAIAANEERGYRYRDDLESLPLDIGVIAMANSGPNTNGSQFFIVTESPQPHLNGLHTVFGDVISGMDVVLRVTQGEKIATVRIEE